MRVMINLPLCYLSLGWLPKPVCCKQTPVCCKNTTGTSNSEPKDEVEMKSLDEEELIDSQDRAVARSENLEGHVVLGGDNVPPLVEIGLNGLPKTGGVRAPLAPPLAIGLQENQGFKEARTKLISILRQSRNDQDLILGEDHVRSLRLAYGQYRRQPKRIQEFFELVIDFADDKTMELVMDHSWQFQRSAVRL